MTILFMQFYKQLELKQLEYRGTSLDIINQPQDLSILMKRFTAQKAESKQFLDIQKECQQYFQSQIKAVTKIKDKFRQTQSQIVKSTESNLRLILTYYDQILPQVQLSEAKYNLQPFFKDILLLRETDNPEQEILKNFTDAPDEIEKRFKPHLQQSLLKNIQPSQYKFMKFPIAPLKIIYRPIHSNPILFDRQKNQGSCEWMKLAHTPINPPYPRRKIINDLWYELKRKIKQQKLYNLHKLESLFQKAFKTKVLTDTRQYGNLEEKQRMVDFFRKYIKKLVQKVEFRLQVIVKKLTKLHQISELYQPIKLQMINGTQFVQKPSQMQFTTAQQLLYLNYGQYVEKIIENIRVTKFMLEVSHSQEFWVPFEQFFQRQSQNRAVELTEEQKLNEKLQRLRFTSPSPISFHNRFPLREAEVPNPQSEDSPSNYGSQCRKRVHRDSYCDEDTSDTLGQIKGHFRQDQTEKNAHSQFSHSKWGNHYRNFQIEEY